DADPVASLDLVAEASERVVAELRLVDEQLERARSVTQGCEHELALRAQEHDPTCDAHDLVGRGAGLEPGVPVLAHLGERVRTIEADGIRILAPGAHRLDPGETRRTLLVAAPT